VVNSSRGFRPRSFRPRSLPIEIFLVAEIVVAVLAGFPVRPPLLRG